MAEFWKDCAPLQEELIAIRRALHRIPELGEHLPETQAYIMETLARWGIPHHPAKRDSAVVGEFSGGKPGKTILLRADVDALPITEETGLPFASRHKGIMHACGHDGHGTMLLGALKVLFDHRAELCGNVRFLFQTSEESGNGAQNAIAEGILDRVDGVFGCHIGSILGPTIPSGTIVATEGCCMAAADRFVITVRGKGCHGSTPEKGIDPVSVAAHIVIALQELISREVAAPQAAVVTVGRITGGNAYNVIPDTVELEGTVRAIDKGVRDYVVERIPQIAAGEAALFRAQAETQIFPFAAPVISDAPSAELVARAAERVVGKEHVMTRLPAPNMGAEDFAYYLEQRPGCYFFVSAANPEKGTCVPHHNARFDIDEDVLWKGSAVFVELTREFLLS